MYPDGYAPGGRHRARAENPSVLHHDTHVIAHIPRFARCSHSSSIGKTTSVAPLIFSSLNSRHRSSSVEESLWGSKVKPRSQARTNPRHVLLRKIRETSPAIGGEGEFLAGQGYPCARFSLMSAGYPLLFLVHRARESGRSIDDFLLSDNLACRPNLQSPRHADFYITAFRPGR